MRSLVVAALSLVALGLVSLSPLDTAADDQTIEVGNLYFCSPQFEDGNCQTSITAGDTVTWNNAAGFHTVTACGANHDPCPLPGGFDSGQMEEGDTFQRTFANAGSFEYYCIFHPSQMQGTILVQAVATATPVAPLATASPTAADTGIPTPTPATIAPASVPRTGAAPENDGAGLAQTQALLAPGLLLAVLGLSVLTRSRQP